MTAGYENCSGSKACHADCRPMVFHEGKLYVTKENKLTFIKPPFRPSMGGNVKSGSAFIFLGYAMLTQSFGAKSIDVLWNDGIYNFGGALCTGNFKEATKT